MSNTYPQRRRSPQTPAALEASLKTPLHSRPGPAGQENVRALPTWDQALWQEECVEHGPVHVAIRLVFAQELGTVSFQLQTTQSYLCSVRS